MPIKNESYGENLQILYNDYEIYLFENIDNHFVCCNNHLIVYDDDYLSIYYIMDGQLNLLNKYGGEYISHYNLTKYGTCIVMNEYCILIYWCRGSVLIEISEDIKDNKVYIDSYINNYLELLRNSLTNDFIM